MKREHVNTSKSAPQVVNMLPEFVPENWVFDRITLVNGHYDKSYYPGQSNVPDGNIMVVYPSGAYPETYMYPIESLYPYLIVGDTYYIRFHARKENVSTTGSGNWSSNNLNVNYEYFFPELANSWANNINNGSTTSWYKYSTKYTPTSSQWPGQTVTNGKYKWRFDCNNNRKYVRYLCLGDFMFINLSECYTRQGYSIPSTSILNSKPYFFGSIDLESW